MTAKTVRSENGGFTLLEFLLYFAIISMVLTAVVGFAVNFLAVQSRSAAYREVGRDGRYAVSRLSAEIRSASGYNDVDSVLGSNPSRLSLSMDDPALDPTVFAVEDGVLKVSRGGGTFESVISAGSEVSEFLVENVSVTGRSRIFRIRLGLRSTDTSQEIVEMAFETTVQIRKGQGFPN